jgi:hypothetical protein
MGLEYRDLGLRAAKPLSEGPVPVRCSPVIRLRDIKRVNDAVQELYNEFVRHLTGLLRDR